MLLTDDGVVVIARLRTGRKGIQIDCVRRSTRPIKKWTLKHCLLYIKDLNCPATTTSLLLDAVVVTGQERFQIHHNWLICFRDSSY